MNWRQCLKKPRKDLVQILPQTTPAAVVEVAQIAVLDPLLSACLTSTVAIVVAVKQDTIHGSHCLPHKAISTSKSGTSCLCNIL